MGKKVKQGTTRNNITRYIRDLKSRQEEVPLVGEFIDLAKCEPLHLKNNVCKEMFMKLLSVVISQACIPNSIKYFKEVLVRDQL